jgi:TetR/AcrR family transcriptional regulator of autoinduction and epiphytic fitness
MADVKTSVRALRAQQTRRRMLTAARDHFAADGFAATTMVDIAATADVAVQTLYYTFRTKGGLLVAAAEFVAAGEVDAEPVMDRDWARRALQAHSGVDVLRLVVENGTAIYRGIASLQRAITEAQSDPVFAEYWSSTAARRKAGIARFVAHIDELGELKLPASQATDLVFVLQSHESYRGLVVNAGWSDEQFQTAMLALLSDALLTSSVPRHRS